MKTKGKVLLSSIASIALSTSIAVGGTFALFTSESKVNIAITSGKVAVVANATDLTTYSMDVEQTEGTFENGGTATLVDNVLTLTNVTPGDKATFTINVENESTISVKYRLTWDVTGDLADGLEILANDAALANVNWTNLAVGEDIASIAVSVELPEEAGNEYRDKTAEISFLLEAVQANAKIVDKWDGTADTSWYNDTDTEFALSTSEALAGLTTLVDGGNTFQGKTIKLDGDLNLEAYDENGNKVSFDPIGYGYDVVFKGTFDGQGHTISNLYQNGWDLGYAYGTQGGGLFASVVDATIKNINLDGVEVVMECVDMGTLVGYSYGTCVYENISLTNATVANYQRYTGGVVGEVNGTQTFKNVDISDSVVSSLWGDFDASIGGIVGGKYGDATLTFEDCDVACELNVYNDVTSSYQWYAYRRAGMLIGNTEETATVDGRTSATASYLTAKNCTVTYGKWADYTYCEFAGTSWPYVRVQGGYSSDPYSNPRYGVATDANGNKVVDDTHVHNDGEAHNVLLVFDQLFGGGQGVYGTATHDGVTVIYNNPSHNN